MDNLSEEQISGAVATMRSAGRSALAYRAVLRISGADRRTDELADRLGALAAAGATDVVIDVDWSHEDAAARACETLRAAVA